MWRAALLAFAMIVSISGVASSKVFCIGQFDNQGDCITERGNLACVGANTCVDHPHDKKFDCGTTLDEANRSLCGVSAGGSLIKAHTGEGGHKCGYEWYHATC